MTTTVLHPLDPLTGAEIRDAIGLLRNAGLLAETARIVSVTNEEPTKRELGEDWGTTKAALERRARVVANEPSQRCTYEGIVNLTRGAVDGWAAVAGARGPVTLDEYEQSGRVVLEHPEFLAGLERRGITKPDQVLVESWGIGGFADAADAGRRVVWTLAFHRERSDDNPYAKPIRGLHAIVDVDEMRVLRVEDSGVVPLPPDAGAYAADRVGPLRSDLRPLEISQPDGPSFELDGWSLRWQRWRLRLSFNAREGLVLHTVGYEDQGRVRTIAYRMSVAELFIPYADPSPFQAWRNAFDIGEYGVGSLTNSLELGCDCLGEIRYLDIELAGGDGEPYTIPQAICIHEEDHGLLWKHVDSTLGTTETRRSRRLVISHIITVGNYEYAFYWYFYTDGTIELEVGLTGILLTSALAPGETSEFGTVVAPSTLAAVHQHFFSVRLDMAVDGTNNSVYEVDTQTLPTGPENPLGNALRPVRRLLQRESQAQRVSDPVRGRYWVIANPSKVGAHGQAAGYKLLPGAGVLAFTPPDAPATSRAVFATKHLWVTPFERSERFPAGDYPNLHAGGAGLPEWTRADRSIEDTDVVVWYTLGSHHIPRPEDWPVMPVERVGFALKPVGFFDRNPALDVAPSADHCAPGTAQGAREGSSAPEA